MVCLPGEGCVEQRRGGGLGLAVNSISHQPSAIGRHQQGDPHRSDCAGLVARALSCGEESISRASGRGRSTPALCRRSRHGHAVLQVVYASGPALTISWLADCPRRTLMLTRYALIAPDGQPFSRLNVYGTVAPSLCEYAQGQGSGTSSAT